MYTYTYTYIHICIPPPGCRLAPRGLCGSQLRGMPDICIYIYIHTHVVLIYIYIYIPISLSIYIYVIYYCTRAHTAVRHAAQGAPHDVHLATQQASHPPGGIPGQSLFYLLVNK